MGSNVKALAVSGTDLFAGTWGGGVFLSTNNGTSWTWASSDWTDLYVEALAVSGTNLFAGTTYGGVFLSTNNGTASTQVNTGLTDTFVKALAVGGTNLFAGIVANTLSGSGVWRRSLSEMISSVQSPQKGLPISFELKQNYPNPFNPSTTIMFDLPKSCVVKLSIHDLLGREVSVLVNERREAGVHEVKFDGSNLASGLYFYRLHAGDFVQSKRLILLK